MMFRCRRLMLTASACAALGSSAVGMDSTAAGASDASAAALPVLLPAQVTSAAASRTSAIPEPVSLAVFGTGLLLLLRRRRI